VLVIRRRPWLDDRSRLSSIQPRDDEPAPFLTRCLGWLYPFVPFVQFGAPGRRFHSILVTDDSQFDYDQVQRVGKVVVDTRNAIKKPQPHVVRLGASNLHVAAEPAFV
jgi:hypothetical protein